MFALPGHLSSPIHPALCPGKLTLTDCVNQLTCPLASYWGPLIGITSRRSGKGGKRGWDVYSPSPVLAGPWFGSGCLLPKAITPLRQVSNNCSSICYSNSSHAFPVPSRFPLFLVPECFHSWLIPLTLPHLFVNKFFIKLSSRRLSVTFQDSDTLSKRRISS